MKSTTEKLTPEQEANLKQFKDSLRDRQTTDLLTLLKMPEFLRYVGKVTKECGVNQAIHDETSNNVLYREGRRSVGEMMLEQVRQVNLEAKFEIERMANRDNQIRENLMNKGAKFNRLEFDGKKV